MTEAAQARSACALCGRPGSVLYADLQDRLFDVAGTWSLLACDACSWIWLDPMPAPEAVAGLYGDYYTHDDREASEESLLERAVMRGIPALRMGYSMPREGDSLERLLARLLSWVPLLRDVAEHAVLWLPVSRTGRLLDVGCGAGRFLERMRDFGWQVMGVEPDPRARERASERLGPDCLIVADLDDPRLGPGLEAPGVGNGGFDAVTLSHVIEHVPDPAALLRRCRELLAPGGLLVCVTPNTRSLGARSFGASWLHWDPPRHLHLFDPNTLARSVRDAGFRVQRVATPSSTAHFVWQASTLLERRGRLPGARTERVSPTLWLESAGFWAFQAVLTRLGRLVGEEVLVVAEKGVAEKGVAERGGAQNGVREKPAA